MDMTKAQLWTVDRKQRLRILELKHENQQLQDKLCPFCHWLGWLWNFVRACWRSLCPPAYQSPDVLPVPEFCKRKGEES